MQSLIVGAPRQYLVRAFVAAALLGGWHGELAAGQRIVVELVGGQQLVAQVDARTSPQRLFLRYERGGAEILRPIDWDHVTRGVVDGKDLEAAAFRAKALEIRSLHSSEAAECTAGKRTCPTLPAGHFEGPLFHRVQSIWADARAANWDGDPLLDGLVLRVVPLDCYGAPAVAEGTVEVELWDEHPRHPRQLGRWVNVVGVGIEQTCLLPFQGDDPQLNKEIGRLGTLRVSYAVPGQGVFECEVRDVTLRPLRRPGH
jgi:hypothetical protein